VDVIVDFLINSVKAIYLMKMLTNSLNWFRRLLLVILSLQLAEMLIVH
jgi:hypothetical protein